MKIDIRDIHQKWFADDAPQNFKRPSASIGAGADGTVTVERDGYGIDAEDYVVSIVEPLEDGGLSAEFEDGTLTITLKSVESVVGSTAAEIASAISTVDGFTATASGTGLTVITEATDKDVAFTDGQFGTPAPHIGIGLKASDYYYISTKADNTQYNDGWRRFTLANY